MASPGQLIKTIAEALGVPEAKVFSTHRYLREAGLVKKGGRGTSAAKMTPRDAATLLVATSGSNDIKQSPRAVERNGHMSSYPGTWDLQFLPLPELTELGDEHTLIDAIEAFISAGISGSLEGCASAITGSDVDLAEELYVPFDLNFSITEPQAYSSITVRTVEYDHENVPAYSNEEICNYHKPRKIGPPESLEFDPPLELGKMYGDLSHQHTFTHRTIMKVANLLKGTR